MPRVQSPMVSTVKRGQDRAVGCYECRRRHENCEVISSSGACLRCETQGSHCSLVSRARPISLQSGSALSSNLPQSLVPDFLEKFLLRLAHLNLTGKVTNISAGMQSHGGYSDIFTGYCSTLPSNGKVEIKRLRVHMAGDKKFQKKLVKELHIWAKLDHPYILRFLGFFFESNDYPSLVSMWMDNGTVLEYLNSHPDCDLQKMVLHIAEGIEYLHSANVVHSDIKPDNILVSSSGEPRICDFGISRMLVESKSISFGGSTTGDLKGTIRYMSIELLSATDEEPHTYSKASDIWAFGMTLLVLLTRKPPYYHIKSEIRVVPIIMSGQLPPVPDDFESWSELYKHLWGLCADCWNKLPSMRPSMSYTAFTLRLPFQQADATSVSWQLSADGHMRGKIEGGFTPLGSSAQLGSPSSPIHPANLEHHNGRLYNTYADRGSIDGFSDGSGAFAPNSAASSSMHLSIGFWAPDQEQRQRQQQQQHLNDAMTYAQYGDSHSTPSRVGRFASLFDSLYINDASAPSNYNYNAHSPEGNAPFFAQHAMEIPPQDSMQFNSGPSYLENLESEAEMSDSEKNYRWKLLLSAGETTHTEPSLGQTQKAELINNQLSVLDDATRPTPRRGYS